MSYANPPDGYERLAVGEAVALGDYIFKDDIPSAVPDYIDDAETYANNHITAGFVVDKHGPEMKMMQRHSDGTHELVSAPDAYALVYRRTSIFNIDQADAEAEQPVRRPEKLPSHFAYAAGVKTLELGDYVVLRTSANAQYEDEDDEHIEGIVYKAKRQTGDGKIYSLVTGNAVYASRILEQPAPRVAIFRSGRVRIVN